MARHDRADPPLVAFARNALAPVQILNVCDDLFDAIRKNI
jgi:hypothetical protein